MPKRWLPVLTSAGQTGDFSPYPSGMVRLTVTVGKEAGNAGRDEKWCIAMMWWNHGWGWGDWLGMSLMMLVFWGAVIGCIVWLIRTNSSRQNAVSPPPPRPEDVLAERFARGEIDEAEYQERLRVLRGAPPAQPTRLDKARAGR